MNLAQLQEKLGLKLLTENADLNKEFEGVITGDLLSHIMGFSKENQVWITIQGHKNVIAVASLKDLACVIIADKQKAEDNMVETAKIEEIPVFLSDKSSYELSGEIFKLINE